ncbi:glycosyltransferase family 4 protein [Desulfobacter postgatei]|uniref:Glycosyltransferase n=1 Tax=Desulfobacter postgatei 2ac9 TaxID=879212 RepID=I5B258_9BACT|nr:glycosyltransferase family 4 protein [Desulfobacter postgatei]EIM63571.1 glycosyltransferase [Desulfobacter postgatei 2ac9]
MPKILILTSLFPNTKKPDLGIFIQKRMFAYARKKACKIEVVAPVPYCPDLKFLRPYQYYSQVPFHETMDGINVYHPRYFMIPKASMTIHGKLIYWGIKNFVQELHKKSAFDLIDGHFIYPDCQAGILLGELLHLPVVVSARGSDINQYMSYSTIKPQISEILTKSSHIISVCEALKQMMLEICPDEKKITVIPNGIDKKYFHQINKKTARLKLGINNDKHILLSIGALIPRKGHDLTIKAAAQLIKSKTPLQFYIIGSGPEEQRLKKLAEHLKIQSDIFFMGQIPNDQLIDWYNAADLFCLSSDKEGWPNVLTESLACGTPVIATKVFGAPEIVKNESMGILVERRYEDIAGGIAKGLANNWNRSAISQEVSSRTWDVVAEECSLVFDEVLAR